MPQLLDVATQAGAIAMSYFRDGQPSLATVEMKQGGSPVSRADKDVDVFLKYQLRPLYPQAGWLSEESLDDATRLSCAHVLIIDPIDGTRAFIRGDKNWVISIAMVENGTPLWGILHAPALAETYFAIKGQGAFCNHQQLSVSTHKKLEHSRIAGPQPILHGLSAQHIDFKAEPKIPSLAYRMARVAKGQIEAGISSTNPYDWDIAAVDLVLHEAGGVLSDLHGRRPMYNQPSPQHDVLVGASAHLHHELTLRLKMAHELL